MNFKKVSDEDLMYKFQKGNESCYNEIVDRYKEKLLNHIFYFVKNKELAEDIVQDTFIRVYLNKDKYKDIAKVSTWIYTIANNLAKTEYAKMNRVEKVSISSGTGPNETEFEIKDNKACTEHPILNKELKTVIMDAIEQLDEKFKEIIILRDIDELSYDDISTIMEIPVGTVKSRINRARLNLRAMIENYL